MSTFSAPAVGNWAAEAIGTLSADARHAAVRTLANSVALSVGATDHPVLRVLRAGIQPSPAGAVTVFGQPGGHDPYDAAFLNGAAAHVEDFDDTHLVTVIHPGCAIVPAALAMAERVQAPGSAVVGALAVGIEATLRLGIVLGSEHFDRGWHLTSSTGRVGAAIAAGLLAGLDAEALTTAIAIAATESAGLQTALGTMTKCYHAGKAAADGLEAALLAASGVRVDATGVLERLAEVTAPAPRPERFFADVGERWEVVDNAFKPYACGIVSHPVIDAGIALSDLVAPGAVEEAVATVNPVVLDVMGVADPTDGLESKFSVYHCFAIGLVDRRGGPRQFTDEHAVDPEIRRLRSLLRVELDPAMPKDACRVEARAGDTWHRVEVEHATASVDRPMTDAQLVDKCLDQAGPVLGDDVARRLVDALFDLDGDVAAADVTALARRPITQGGS